jgi:aryl-alcohol dehydrogenase (NADP+)
MQPSALSRNMSYPLGASSSGRCWKVRRFNNVARQNGLAPAVLALAWLLNRPGVTAPIIGVSKPHQWDASLASVNVPWTSSLAEAVEEAFAD